MFYKHKNQVCVTWHNGSWGIRWHHILIRYTKNPSANVIAKLEGKKLILHISPKLILFATVIKLKWELLGGVIVMVAIRSNR